MVSSLVLPSLAFGKYVKFDDGCGPTDVNCCPSWLYYPTQSFKSQLDIDHQTTMCEGSKCDGVFNGVLSTTNISPSTTYSGFQAEMTWTILPCGNPGAAGNPNADNFKCIPITSGPTHKFFDPPLELPDFVSTFALKQEATRADGTTSTTYYTVDGCERDISDIDPVAKKASVTLTITPQCCMNNKAGWKPLPNGESLQWVDTDDFGTCQVDPNGPTPPAGFSFDSQTERFIGQAGPGACQGDSNGVVTRPDMRFTGGTVNRAYKMMCEQRIITRAQFGLKATLNPTKSKNAGQIQFDVKVFKSGCTVQGSDSVLSGKFYPGKTPIVGYGAFLGPLWLSLGSLAVLFALFSGGWMYLFMATGCCGLCIRCCIPAHTEEDDLFHDKELKDVTLRYAVKSGLNDEQRADDEKTMSARAVRSMEGGERSAACGVCPSPCAPKRRCCSPFLSPKSLFSPTHALCREARAQ